MRSLVSYKIILALAFLLNFGNLSLACSVMSMSDQNQSVTGYSMEWVGQNIFTIFAKISSIGL